MAQRIEYGACPLCASPDIAPSLVGDCAAHPCYDPSLPARMQWMDCSACAHQFTEGYFDADALDTILRVTHAGQQVGHQIEAQRAVSARMVEKVLPHVASGRWLDIGFGNASLLFTAAEYGFEPVGVDLRADNVETLRQLGIEAHCAPVETLRFAAPFQVVSMMDVLEHVPYPAVMLAAVRDNLAENGCVLLSMPNTETLLWTLMTQQNANPYLGEIEHYHNFSRTRLYALLRETGLEPLRYGISERYRACMEVVARKPASG